VPRGSYIVTFNKTTSTASIERNQTTELQASRIEVADLATCPALSEVYFEFTAADGKGYQPGFTAGGAPSAYSDGTPTSCTADGNVEYCVLPYSAFGGVIGDKLTGTHGVSYEGVAQDYAPGTGGYVPQAFLSGKGTDYVLAGCTAAVCPVLTSAVRSVNVTTASFVLHQVFAKPETNTTVYHWHDNFTALHVAATGNRTAGNATFTIRDGANATVAKGGPHNLTLDLAVNDAKPGNWTITVAYDGFVGSLALDLTQALAAPPTNTTTPAPSLPPQNVTASRSSTSASTPAPGWGALGATVLGLAAWRRRRPTT